MIKPVKKKFFKSYLEAKAYAKKVGGRTRPVYEIGPKGGKKHIGYNAEWQ